MAKMYGKGGKILAQRGYFKDQAFINYLKYLQYWKEPEYAKYLMYPMCLYFLDLLQYEHFRREIVNSQCCKFIDDQAILQWQHYTRKRIKMFNSVNNTQLNAAATCGTEINEAQQPQMAAQQPGSNSAAGVNIQNGNTGVNTQQAQLVGSQQQPQQMNGTNSST
uniref:Mediator of RNA polymerase II transcription subunit 31 n=1 Tax=Glossina austeni TaxID=7395 RepID=A0A1A9VBE1_GLOAU